MAVDLLENRLRKKEEVFFDRLKPIEWLSNDVREVFERGIQSKDIEIIRKVAYLPILLAQHAIEYKENLIFQEFIYFPQLLYAYAFEEKKTKNDKLANFMFDRTWWYIKELSDFHLEPKLRKEGFSEEEFKGFAIYLLKIFQSLLKNTVDNGDSNNFKKFLSKSLNLFKSLMNFNYSPSKDKSRDIFEYLNQIRKQMIFGLASWIFHLWEGEEDKNSSILKEMFYEIRNKLSIDIEDFTDVFLDSHDFKVEDFWGWNNWELQEKEDEEECHNILILEKLEKFYAINSLILLQNKTNEEIEKIRLPHNRSLANLVEGSRDLRKVLDDIEGNQKNWEFVLNDNAVKKVQSFKNLLEKARQEQEEEDLKIKRETNISEEKIIKFKKNVVNDFYENATLRNILKYYKLYKNESNKEYFGNLKKLGISTFFDKAAFFDDKVEWYISFVGIDNGFDFGRRMSDGENYEILQKIEEKCTQIEEKDFETKLMEIGKPGNSIIIATNSAICKFLEKSLHYIPKWHQNYPKHLLEKSEGLYTFDEYNIPVYEVINRERNSCVFILDKTNLGELIQYSPLDKNGNKNLKEDIFIIDVQEYLLGTELAKKITDNPPEWLKRIGDKQSQQKYLQEKVLINFFERFEYHIDGNFAGYKLIIEN